MKNITFRLDANAFIGSGHLMRCLPIAQEVALKGFKCHFLCIGLPKSLAEKIICNGHDVHNLSNDNEAFDILDDLKPIWLIIDHYHLDRKFEKKAILFCQKILVVDDLANRFHHCNILLDQGPLKTPQDYKKWVNKECSLFLGSRYIIVDKNFRIYRKKNIGKWEKGLICFGGSDNDNITLAVLKELEKDYSIRNIEWTVLTGIMNPHWNDIENFVQQSQLNIALIKHSNKIAELLAKNDFTIGAAGGMIYERACIGIPSLSIPIAKNQSFSIEVINKHKLGETLKVSELSQKKIISSLSYLRKNAIKYMNRSQSIVDGRGVIRLVEDLLKYHC